MTPQVLLATAFAPTLALSSVAGASIAGGVAVLIGCLVALGYYRPQWLVRGLFWILGHTIYRVRTHGLSQLPTKGPVLLVCNQASYIDALLLLAVQRRPIRFVIWSPFVRLPIPRLLLHLAQVIVLNRKAGPRALIRSLRKAAEALGRGEAVCLFAEGGVTRSGFVLPFHRAFEQILERTPAPVVPVCLDLTWGSLFNHRGRKFFWKWPQKLPYPVHLAFGSPLPPTVKAVEVRLAIEKLSADQAVARNQERLPPHRQFVRMAARHPFRTCMLDSLNRGKMYRYGEVLAGAWLVRDLLQPIVRDDRMVGIWLPPGAGGAFANIAVTFLGKAPVNLNYTSSAAVVQSAIRQCGIRKVLTARAFTARVPIDPGLGVELVYLDDLRGQVTSGKRIRTFLTVLCLPAFVLDRWMGLHRHKPDDLSTIIFSSGSTGDPKGVMLLHRNIAANVESVVQVIDPRPSDRVLGILPFFHSFGFTVTIWVPLMVGASIVYHADPRQAQDIGDLCRTLRCTIWLTTPTFMRLCLRRCGPDDFKSLRYLICGAEKLPATLAHEFDERFGVLPLEGYGCTELAPVAAVNAPDWREPGPRQISYKMGSIGQPIPGVAARIVHPETLEPVAPGEEGLLLLYGGNVMAGYLGRPDATAAALHEGWYKTGDIARFDEDGYIIITDRLARFSKIGGEMVPHQKIEDELHVLVGTHERMFVVAGVPDPKKGERLVVLHMPLNGTSVRDLWQQLNCKGLPNLWLPGERDFFEVPEMPILGSGKLDLKRARTIAIERAQAG